ncbi:WXG100 family type VII secretion target [Nocardioides alkalitolerans]|uniref:WXG100 family type VII secretion target n=1 Tax=Nocardioides alkalitolerans TaxID=281714 RepID=UPI0004199965|nr:hypothetical protein [Nocardioides alkalitolerans]
MGESFHVEEEHLAGFAVLCSDLSLQTASVMGHVLNEAKAESGFTGLMELVKPAVDEYAHLTGVRIANRVDLLTAMGTELNRAAWDYSGADRKSYEEISPIMPGQVTGYKDFPGPVGYPAGTAPSLDAPALEEADIRGILDDVGGSINAVDDAIAFITGWSPVTELVTPMSGNWNALSRAGTVLEQTGDGAEQVATNLTTQLAPLGGHWDGGAALAFDSYAARVAAALDIEGPINRLVGFVYTTVAAEFERVATFMVGALKDAVDKIVQAAATAWIPGAGWIKIIDAVRKAIEIIQEAKDLIDSLMTVVEQVNTVVEAAQDPIGFVQGQVEEQLAPLIEAAEAAGTAVDIGSDLIQVTDPSGLTDVPTEDYGVGANPRRNG